MKSIERVFNTVQGLPVDRPPVFAVLGAYGKKYVDSSMKTIFSDPNAYASSQLKVVEKLGFDLALGPFDFSVIGEAFGGQVFFFNEQPPNIKKFAIKTPEDFFNLPQPSLDLTGRLPFVMQAISALNEKLRDDVPVFATIPGPAAFPVLIMGLEKWIETWLFKPDLRNQILELTTEFLLRYAAAIVEAGASGLVVIESVACSEIFSRKTIRDEILPIWKDFFPKLKGPVIFHHGGGKINHILDLLSPLKEILGVVIGGNDDINEARLKLGPKKTIIGNIDNLKIPFWSRKHTFDVASECLQIGTVGGPFILSNSAADIPLNTPEENLFGMVAASRAFVPKSNLTGGS